MVEIEQLVNIQNEILVIGSIYKQPNLYVEYGRKIRSKYDFFDKVTRFLYDNFEIYYKTFSQTINEDKLNTFMSQNADRLKTYRKYGGWKTISEWMSLANIEDFKNYFEIVKKYSLLREYHRRGYNVERIINHSKFNFMKASDIYKIIRSGADKISTQILSEEGATKMNKDNASFVKHLLIKPQMGLQMPFELLNELFRGFRLGKMFALGFLSNEGKTRLATFIACYIAFVKKQKVYFMANETSEEDMRSCILTTVINNDCFKEIHGVDIGQNERNIVLGIYKDKNGNLLTRNKDETEEEFIDRVQVSSPAFNNVLKVAEWLDNQTNTTIFFERLTDYSNENLEFKIRNMNISKGIKYFVYDTLKGYRDESWNILKQTATMLSDLMGELNCYLWADIQLTDDSVYTNIFDFSSNNIAGAKQMKHVLDYLILGKRLDKQEYHKYKIVPNDTACWGSKSELDLDLHKVYYGLKIDKNRGGEKDKIPVVEVDLNKNIWKELGYLIKA